VPSLIQISATSNLVPKISAMRFPRSAEPTKSAEEISESSNRCAKTVPAAVPSDDQSSVGRSDRSKSVRKKQRPAPERRN